MAKAVLADSIASLPEFNAWYNVIKATVAELDLGALLIYIVDNADSSVLSYLAEQMDVLGYKGFRLAQSETDQRQIIKRAIELHRYKGTEWAVQEALKSIGFTDIQLKKGYDHWAKFGIKITNSNVQLTATSFNDIVQMVNEYKRAVCVLVDVSLDVVVDDVLNIGVDDGVALPAYITDDLLSLTGVLKYDGNGHYDGTFDHSGDSDIISITQL